MDALASICVSEPKGEVFVMGVQFNHKEDRLDIRITGNLNKDSLGKPKEHLTNVLRKVQ